MRAVLSSLAICLGALAACTSDAPDRRACTEQMFENDAFIVCPLDPQRQDVRLVWQDAKGVPYRGFSALARDVNTASVGFAMNAGMYNNTGAPIGLYVENGQDSHAINTNDGPGNFHLKPNGVFWVDGAGAPHVASTDAYIAEAPEAVFATQSGPMLVIDGALHPAFDHDGDSRHIRNGVGVHDGKAWFVISARPVSFGKFARFFRDELGNANALYLDGAVSSLWAPDVAHGRALSARPAHPRHVEGGLMIVLKRERSDRRSMARTGA
jgi:uncharacterized protein YigE (DUF2233 family)